MVGKWFALTACLYLLNRLRYFDGVLLMAGLATMHMVIVLKIFGLVLKNLMQEHSDRTLKSRQRKPLA